jgi:hypothetical protein
VKVEAVSPGSIIVDFRVLAKQGLKTGAKVELLQVTAQFEAGVER